MTARRLPLAVLVVGALLVAVGPCLDWIGARSPDGCVGFQCYATASGGTDATPFQLAPHTTGWGVSPVLAALGIVLLVVVGLAIREADRSDATPSSFLVALGIGGVGLAVGALLVADHRSGTDVLVRLGQGYSSTRAAFGAWLTAVGGALLALGAAATAVVDRVELVDHDGTAPDGGAAD